MIRIKIRFWLGLGFGIMPIKRRNGLYIENWIVIACFRILITKAFEL